MLREFLSYRSHRIALLLVLLLSLVCTQIPLFNYLGFEFSALMAVVASFCAGLLTVSSWRKGATTRSGTVWYFALRLSLPLGLLLFIPLVPISLNALFVKNCSFIHGAILYLLIPLPSVIFAHALALLISVVMKGQWKTWFVLLWLLVLFHIIVITVSYPQVFAFNPIVGFFPGFTYDETLDIVGRLLVYRLGTAASVILLILFAVIVDARASKRSLNQDDPGRPIGLKVAVASVLLLLLTGMYLLSDRLNISSSEDHIAGELGGRIETDHFVIVYPDTMVKGRRLAHLIQLHEFYFDQLSKFLRVEPRRKIHSYLYASAEQKGRLIGAAGTNIAKPWLWQLHLNVGDADASLKHELVHVMAADFGFPFLRVGVNSGLIEGLATAAENVEYEEQLHHLAAMIFAVGIDPAMEDIFSISGFMRAHPSVSYVLAGSFCRYLIDRYGIRRFKLVYKSGDFSTFYNRELGTLVVDWRRHVDRASLGEADLQKAAYLFKRPSIFAKECARVVANSNAETRSIYGQKKYQEALESANRSLGLSTSIEAIFQKANSLFKLQRYAEVIQFAEEKLRDSAIGHSLLPLRLVLGDSYWAVDSTRRANDLYRELMLAHVSQSWDEASAIRLEVLSNSALSRHIKPLFLKELSDTERTELLSRANTSGRSNALADYLQARELSAMERFDDAIRLWTRIPRMKSDALEYHRHRRIARHFFAIGKYQKSKLHLWQALNYVAGGAHAVEIDERLKLCDWMDERIGKAN